MRDFTFLLLTPFMYFFHIFNMPKKPKMGHFFTKEMI